MEDTTSTVTVPSDLDFISYKNKYVPTLSTQVLYSEDELKEAAKTLAHRTKLSQMQSYQNDTSSTARKESGLNDVDIQKNPTYKKNDTRLRKQSSSPSLLQYIKGHEVLGVRSPSSTALYSLQEFEKNVHKTQQKISERLDSEKELIRSASEVPSVVQYEEKFKPVEQGSLSTAVLYSEREIKETTERMRIRGEVADRQRLFVESNSGSQISYFQTKSIPSISSAASPSLAPLYSERELSQITEKMKQRLSQTSSSIPYTEKELVEKISKKQESQIESIKASQAAVTKEEMILTSDLPLSVSQQFYENMKTQYPYSIKGSLAVLYSEREIKEMNEKLQEISESNELDPHYSRQYEYRSMRKRSSPSIDVMFSEKELEETRRRFEATSTTPLSDIFTFGTVSNVPSLSFFMEEKMRYKKEQLPIEESEEEEEEKGEDKEDEEIIWQSLSAVSLSSGPSKLSGWEMIGRTPEDWNSVRWPGNGLLDYFKLDLDDNEINGILTDRIIATGQSCLGHCPGSLAYVYTKLELKGKNLCDISILHYHRYLQYIDLSWNQLQDISALGYVRYLVYLDVSHNELNTLLNFRAPWFLCHVNYSFNYVTYIGDLSEFWAIKFLDLSHNNIMKIEGLKNLRYLQFLDLSYNEIKTIENLESLNLSILNLECNIIYDYTQDLSSLLGLKYINLNRNKLKSLGFIKNMTSLRYMDMKKNKLSQLLEIDILHSLKALEILDFTGNPITTWPNYREAAISYLPSLAVLDGITITVEEKVFAKNTFNPDVEIIAAWNHTRLLLFEHFSNPLIGLDIIPVDQPAYPLVVLVGPPSSGKSYLISRMVEEFGSKVYVGLHHTTLKSYDHCEVRDESYYVTQQQFNEMSQHGEFLTTAQYLGYSYGFSRKELANAVKMRSVCITNMWLPEALTLHASGVQPCLILTIVDNKSTHLNRLNKDYDTRRTSVFQPGGIQQASKKRDSEHEDKVKEDTIEVDMFKESKSFERDTELDNADVPKKKNVEIYDKHVEKYNSFMNEDNSLSYLKNVTTVEVNSNGVIEMEKENETENRELDKIVGTKGSPVLEKISKKDIRTGEEMHETKCRIKQNLLSNHKIKSESIELKDTVNEICNTIIEKSVQSETKFTKPQFSKQGMQALYAEQSLESELNKQNIKVGAKLTEENLEPEFGKQSVQLRKPFTEQSLAPNLSKQCQELSKILTGKTSDLGFSKQSVQSGITISDKNLEAGSKTTASNETFDEKNVIQILESKFTEETSEQINKEGSKIMNEDEGLKTKENKIHNQRNSIVEERTDAIRKVLNLKHKSEMVENDECFEDKKRRNEQNIDVIDKDMEENSYIMQVADDEEILKNYISYSSINKFDDGNKVLHLSPEDTLNPLVQKSNLLKNNSFVSQSSETSDPISAEKSFSQFTSDSKIFSDDEYKEKFIKMALQFKNAYWRVHQQNPGFFEDVVYTDDLDEATFQLKEFLKRYLSYPKKYPVLSPERDPSYSEFILGKINSFTEDLNRCKSVMAQQRYEILQPLNKHYF